MLACTLASSASAQDPSVGSTSGGGTFEDIGDPGEDDPTADDPDQPSTEEPTASRAQGRAAQARDDQDEPAAERDAALSPQAQAEIRILRTIEARLSVGDGLNEAQQKELTRLVSEGDDPRVRALAAAVLPWLGPVILSDLLAAAEDPEAMVRAQAMSSLVSLARTMNDTQKAKTESLAKQGLSDRSDEVACAASRVLVSLDPQAATETLEAVADDATDVRFGCYRQYAGLPMREIEIAEPVLPDPVLVTPGDTDRHPADQVNLMAGLGRGIMVATYAGAGVVAGGLLNGTFFPARDTLTYTRRTTTHAREEPNVLFGAAGALAGGAALGAAAFGLQYGLGWADFAPSAALLGMTLAGSAGGYGLGLTFALDEPYAGLSWIGGTLAGLAIGTPFVWLLKPDEKDLTMMAAAAGAMTMSGAMMTYVLVPEGFDTLFEGTFLNPVKRADFGTGIGLMAGSAGAMAALMASPLLDISHGRMLASSGAGLAAGATGLALGYLIPVGFDSLELGITRSRIASGLGLIAGWSVGLAVFVLLPDSWSSMFAKVKANRSTSAVAIEDGELKIGTPVVWTRDVSTTRQRRTAIGLDLFSGEF